MKNPCTSVQGSVLIIAKIVFRVELICQLEGASICLSWAYGIRQLTVLKRTSNAKTREKRCTEDKHNAQSAPIVPEGDTSFKKAGILLLFGRTDTSRGENSHRLRLASGLADLRRAKPNLRICKANAMSDSDYYTRQHKRPAAWTGLLCCGVYPI